jgi:hypothetical protein
MDPPAPVNGGFRKAAKEIVHEGYPFASGMSSLARQKGDTLYLSNRVHTG